MVVSETQRGSNSEELTYVPPPPPPSARLARRVRGSTSGTGTGTETETPNAGIVCSSAVAHRLGIGTATPIPELCNVGGETAYPFCPLTNFGFITDPSNDQKCVTVTCPDGFKNDPNNPLRCIKPIKTNTSLLSANNHERWYDWFVIPEYHLGNKYSTAKNVNYAPCPKHTVPFYAVDPVDTPTPDPNDKLNKCVSKKDYFAGKYESSASFCPLAWVMRSAATKDDYRYIYKAKIDELKAQNLTIPEMDNLEANINTYIENDIYKPIQAEGYTDFISAPITEESANACRALNSDTARLQTAYDICKMLYDKPEKEAIQYLMDKNGEKDNEMTKAKYERGKQACNAVFCNDDDGAITAVNGTPLCFKGVKRDTVSAEIKQATIHSTPISSNPARHQSYIFIVDYLRYYVKLFLTIIVLSIVIFKVIIPLIILIGETIGFLDKDIRILKNLRRAFNKEFDTIMRENKKLEASIRNAK